MRNLLLVLTLLVGSTSLLAQTKNSPLVDLYGEDERLSRVFVSGKIFELFHKTKLRLDDVEAELVLDAIEGVDGLYLFVDEESGTPYRDETQQILSGPDYEPLLSVRGRGSRENVDLYVRGTDAILNELVVMVSTEDEFVLIVTGGAIDLEKIVRLQRELRDRADTPPAVPTATPPADEDVFVESEIDVRILNNGGAHPELVLLNPEHRALTTTLTDAQGRTLKTLMRNRAGQFQWRFPAEVPSGMYWVRVFDETGLVTAEQIVVTRLP